MAGALTDAQKLVSLWCWFDEAAAASISVCELLEQKACATLNGGTGGGGVGSGTISSTSSAGHSVSFFGPNDQPISPAGQAEYVAVAATRCDACAEFTDKKEWALCMLNQTRGITSFVKSYWGMRGCGCGC
jgi:hypothetical protein